MPRILRDRAGHVLLLSVGSVSTGIDAVDVLGMIQSTLVSIDDSITDCSTALLFDSTTDSSSTSAAFCIFRNPIIVVCCISLCVGRESAIFNVCSTHNE